MKMRESMALRDMLSAPKLSDLPGDSLRSSFPPCLRIDREMALSSLAFLGVRRLKDLNLMKAGTNAAPCWAMVSSQDAVSCEVR
jgi:hypothetical protein